MKHDRFLSVAAAICLGAPALWAADIRGKITSISPADPQNAGRFLGAVLIEGAIQKDTTHDKAMTRVWAQTQLFKMENGKKIEAHFSDLKVGQTVEATFSGPVAESYPVLATAGEIVILKPPETPPPDRDDALIDIRGKITRLHLPDPRDDDLVRYLHVEGALEKDTRHDKASVRVPATARVFKLMDGRKLDAKYTDLKQGQIVEVKFAGPVAKSYPVQGSAAEIIILDEPQSAPAPRLP
jgi:hypothetical protein